MKNPFAIFQAHAEEPPVVDAQAEYSIAADLQEALQSKAWWEEKRDALDCVHLDSEYYSKDPIQISDYEFSREPFFGEDELWQMPQPDISEHQVACRAWDALIYEFKSRHAAYYQLWSLGVDDMGVVLRCLQAGPGGIRVDAGQLDALSGMLLRDPRVAMREPNSFGLLFGGAINAKLRGEGNKRHTDYYLSMTARSEATEQFEALARKYDQDRDKGRSVLEYWAERLSSALGQIEEEQALLQQYCSQAAEKYSTARCLHPEDIWGRSQTE